MPLDPSEIEATDARASTLMKRGIRLMGEAGPGEALVCFDEALALRRQLPFETTPRLRYGLAACWLNRGEALTALADLSAALAAYDEGLVVLSPLPLDEDARFPRRLAVAHQNRGLVLQALGRTGDAIVAIEEAVAVLDRAPLVSDREHLVAVVWLNLANAVVSAPTGESDARARDAAARAIALVADREAGEVDAAEVGLRARHVLCQALVSGLPPASDGGPLPDVVHEATDAVDDGLDLVRRWEQQGVTRFRALAYDLFRFGAGVYARYQPQFLREFVDDNMDPLRSSADYVESLEMRSAAREALGR